MKMLRFGILLFPLTAACVLAGRAEAQQSPATLPWYLEGSFGESRWDTAAGTNYQAPGATFDSRDTSYGFIAGLPLSQYLAIELGHTNFGKLSANGVFVGQPADGGAPYLRNARVKANTTYAAVSAHVPLGQAFTLFGQLGYGSTTRKVVSDDIVTPFSDTGTITIVGENNKSRKSEMMYGFGAGYAFSKTVTGLLRYQKLDDTKASAVMLGVRLAL